VGVAARTVRAPDGLEWHVRVYRFRPPEWRRFQPLFEEGPDLSPFLPFGPSRERIRPGRR